MRRFSRFYKEPKKQFRQHESEGTFSSKESAQATFPKGPT